MSPNIKRLLTILTTALLALGLAACKEKATVTHSDTEVKEKPFSDDKQVTQTDVIEKDGKIQVREKKTEIDDDGGIEEQKTTIKGDKIE